MKTIDLHVHSCYSDGLHTPEDLVQQAVRQGVAVLAIADHDSVEGIDEGISAARKTDIQFIPAVELSVEYGPHHDIHLLGYALDHRDGAFHQKLEEFRKRRDDRGRQIIDKINELLSRQGKSLLHYEELSHSTGGALGRPHIARQLIAKGAASDMADAFARYLVPCDVPKQYFPIADAIAEIHRIKGLAILAHPPSISNDRTTLRSVIAELAELGLDGIEAFSNMSSRDDTLFLSGTAARLSLVTTGGSDYHGEADGVTMGELRSGLPLTEEHVRMLRERHERLFPGMWVTHCWI